MDTLVDGCGLFGSAARRLGVVEEPVDVQVDTQVVNVAIVVGIEYVLGEAVVLPDLAFGLLGEHLVLVVAGEEVTIELSTGMAIVFIECTDAVVLIEHIVDLQLW